MRGQWRRLDLGAGPPGDESWLLPFCVTLGTRANLSECGVAIASSVKVGMVQSSRQEAPGRWGSNVSILWAEPGVSRRAGRVHGPAVVSLKWTALTCS